ncbi:histidine phosphatase superfamily [Amylocarpus encephaloides]|uniref:Histidine phosphatase superfamily n=1 Tax=Amylocarpus encephaloides TaxID=45428 RepID=A0A9P7YM10_9HELO|nr:histidine phosphatase superfamily [Amylocarpus encephaloides]
MPPTAVLIRHAQALHNIHDPPLSGLGFGPQCQELSKHLEESVPLAQKIDLIVISPMRRTLQTATQSLGWLIDRGVPVLLAPLWQENSSNPCDTGTPIPIMREEWPQFDWDAVDPLYPAKSGIYSFSKKGLGERGREARRWLKNRPEQVIAVVSHSAFLKVGVSNKRFYNADYRVFEFKEDGEGRGDGEDRLVEWEETETRGGGLGKSGFGMYFLGPGCYPKESETPAEEVLDGAGG